MNELYERAVKSFDTVDGIKVLPIGEDAITFVAIGHHHPKTALQLFNAEAKGLLGWSDLLDGDHVPMHDDDCVEEDCPRHQPDSWLDDLTQRVEQTWAYFHEHCDSYGDQEHEADCDECAEIQECGWFITWEARQTPETFPVTVFRT